MPFKRSVKDKMINCYGCNGKKTKIVFGIELPCNDCYGIGTSERLIETEEVQKR